MRGSICRGRRLRPPDPRAPACVQARSATCSPSTACISAWRHPTCRARRRSCSPPRIERVGSGWRTAAEVRLCCARTGSRSAWRRGGACRWSWRCRIRRRRSGPRRGCGSCGRAGARVIRSSCWTSSRPEACFQAWRSRRRLNDRPLTVGRGSWRPPCRRGLDRWGSTLPPGLHSTGGSTLRPPVARKAGAGWRLTGRQATFSPAKNAAPTTALCGGSRPDARPRHAAVTTFVLSPKSAY
jgi:hypothetical protein